MQENNKMTVEKFKENNKTCSFAEFIEMFSIGKNASKTLGIRYSNFHYQFVARKEEYLIVGGHLYRKTAYSVDEELLNTLADSDKKGMVGQV